MPSPEEHFPGGEDPSQQDLRARVCTLNYTKPTTGADVRIIRGQRSQCNNYSKLATCTDSK